jgi:outer membrane lipoprotein carrier protein
MRQICAAVLLLLVSARVPAQQPAETPQSLARALQERYAGIRDFSADFTQTYRGGALRTETRERGTVTIKKPGRMRWVYTDPERKEIVSDGRTLYFYLPQDKRVIVSDVSQADEATTGPMFLAGRGDVIRDFAVTAAKSRVQGASAIELTPRKPQADYDRLIVTLDPRTLQIRALTTIDRLGGENTLILTNLKENRGISDKEFEFRIPRGVTVDRDGTRP